jgi:hypothetical protein
MIGHHGINPIYLFMIPIDTQFILHPQRNQDYCRQTHRQTKQVDGEDLFELHETAEGEYKLVSEHGEWGVGGGKLEVRKLEVRKLEVRKVEVGSRRLGSWRWEVGGGK